MTFLTKTPLDCAVHPEIWYSNYSSALFDYNDVVSEEGLVFSRVSGRLNGRFLFQPKFARYLRTYSKKYCTEMHVSPFLLYFPFTLFLIPLLIVFIEKFFIT